MFYSQCIANVNLLDLLNDLEQELKLQRLAEHMLAIAVMRNVLMDNLFELAKREVDNTSTCMFHSMISSL